MKNELYNEVTNLNYSIDILMGSNANGELISLLEHASNLGNMSVLYLDRLNDEVLKDVKSILGLAEKIAEEKDTSLQDEMCGELRKLVDPVENLFRIEGFILDDVSSKVLNVA